MRDSADDLMPQEIHRLLAAVYPTRYERFLKRLVTICFALAPNERGPFSALGVWIDERWSRRVRRRGDRNAALAASRPYDVPGDCEVCDGWHPDGECPPPPPDSSTEGGGS